MTVHFPGKRSMSPPRGKRPVTMADIARLAGVSKITVSRAMSPSALVNERTREKILQIARKHGYKFNASARNLRLQRSQTVAVVVEMTPSVDRPMSHPYPLDLLGGILEEMSGQGLGVLLATRREILLPSVQSADAVILLGQGAHLDAVRLFDHLQVPLVIWGAQGVDSGHVTVGSADRQGGSAAAERFIAIGRRSLAFLGDVSHAELAQRQAGFAEALAPHGLSSHLVRCSGFTVDAGYRALKTIGPRLQYDAVFAGSDLLAMGAIRALGEMNRRVPEDVSVVGYDDSAMAAAFIPALTTIHQNWVEGGRLLARKAIAMINGLPVTSEMLAVHLVTRAT